MHLAYLHREIVNELCHTEPALVVSYLKLDALGPEVYFNACTVAFIP